MVHSLQSSGVHNETGANINSRLEKVSFSLARESLNRRVANMRRSGEFQMEEPSTVNERQTNLAFGHLVSLSYKRSLC